MGKKLKTTAALLTFTVMLAFALRPVVVYANAAPLCFQSPAFSSHLALQVHSGVQTFQSVSNFKIVAKRTTSEEALAPRVSSQNSVQYPRNLYRPVVPSRVVLQKHFLVLRI